MQSRRRFLGKWRASLALFLLGSIGRGAAAQDGIVVVDGWILRRSDLDLLR
jgi:hypothetical protein